MQYSGRNESPGFNLSDTLCSAVLVQHAVQDAKLFWIYGESHSLLLHIGAKASVGSFSRRRPVQWPTMQNRTLISGTSLLQKT